MASNEASLDSDIQKNISPSMINNPDRIDNGQAFAYNYLTDYRNIVANRPPPTYSAATSQSPVISASSSGMDWTKIATSMAGGIPALAGVALGSLTSLYTDLDRNNILRRQVEGNLELNSQALAFQQRAFDQNWSAATSVGLASPAQFGAEGAGVYYGNSAGPSTSRGLRVGMSSPYIR